MYILLIIICTTLALFALAMLIESVAKARLERMIKKRELEKIETKIDFMAEGSLMEDIQNILINVCLVCMSIAALAITYACASM